MASALNLSELLDAALVASVETPTPEDVKEYPPVDEQDPDVGVITRSKKASASKSSADGSGGRMKMVGSLPIPRASRYQLFDSVQSCYVNCALAAPSVVMQDRNTLVRSGPNTAVGITASNGRQIPIHSTSPAELAQDKISVVTTGMKIKMTTRCELPNQTACQTTDPNKVAHGDCKKSQEFTIDFFRPTKVPKSGDIASGICVPLEQLADLIRVTPEKLGSSLQPDQVADLPIQTESSAAAGVSSLSKRIKMVGVQAVMQSLLAINLPAEYQLSSKSAVPGTTKIVLPACTLGALPHSAFVHYVFLIMDAVRAEFSDPTTKNVEVSNLSKKVELLERENAVLKQKHTAMETSLTRVVRAVLVNPADTRILKNTAAEYYLKAIANALKGQPVPDMSPLQKKVILACIPVCEKLSGGDGGSAAAQPAASASASASAPKKPTTPSIVADPRIAAAQRAAAAAAPPRVDSKDEDDAPMPDSTVVGNVLPAAAGLPRSLYPSS